MSQRQGRIFTGRHMAIILIVFFGVVIAVNFTMARIAVGTFGGTVVDNSYVASQNYNRWLAAAARQDRLGWSVSTSLDANRFVVIAAQYRGSPIAGLTASGRAVHPLDRAKDVEVKFAVRGDGRLVSTHALPAGRWTMQVALRRGAQVYKLTEPLQ